MKEFALNNNVKLRPHAKMHKSIDVAKYQIDNGGAHGICCQKVSEAEIFVRAGIKDILITNQITDAFKLDRLAKITSKELKIGCCVDNDENKIKDLSNKKITFYEPGLEEYFNDDETFKRMSFSSDYASIEWDNIDIVFVCVQTPNNIETNSVDTKFLESAIKEINNVNNNDLVITVKSTIPPYEIEKVCEKVGMDSSKLTFNPEFLREGTAVEDFFKPDRIVLGGTDSEKLSKLKELYSGFECEIIITDSISSQLIKYLANTYLPLRLSFVNEATRIINYSGGNLDDV